MASSSLARGPVRKIPGVHPGWGLIHMEPHGQVGGCPSTHYKIFELVGGFKHEWIIFHNKY